MGFHISYVEKKSHTCELHVQSKTQLKSCSIIIFAFVETLNFYLLAEGYNHSAMYLTNSLKNY